MTTDVLLTSFFLMVLESQRSRKNSSSPPSATSSCLCGSVCLVHFPCFMYINHMDFHPSEGLSGSFVPSLEQGLCSGFLGHGRGYSPRGLAWGGVSSPVGCGPVPPVLSAAFPAPLSQRESSLLPPLTLPQHRAAGGILAPKEHTLQRCLPGAPRGLSVTNAFC